MLFEKLKKLRFSFDTVDGWYNDYEGWYIDDVEIIKAEDKPLYVPLGTISYIYANDKLVARVDKKPAQSEKVYYYHNDYLGSTRVMTDSMGEIVWSSDYLPFGELINTEGKIENNFTFTGKEYDEATGLYYFGARYYDPKVGRFITKDPWSCTPEDERIINGALYPIIAQLIITEGLTIPQNIHPYMYCYNNPINYIDPYGYCGEEIAIGGLLIPPAKLLEITKAVRGPYITEYAKRLDALLKWAAKRAVMKATFIAADWIDPPILNEGEKELLEEWRKKYGSGSQKVE